MTALRFSLLYEIIGQGSLRIESDDSLYDFIRKGIEMNPEMFCLLEFVRLEYCSTDVMDDFFDLLWQNSYEINVLIWATLCARLVLPNININERQAKQFPPLVKKGERFDVPDGVIAHLTREFGGNMHDRHVIEVTSGSFEKETRGANPHSGAYNKEECAAAKNASDLEATSYFCSASRGQEEDVPHTKNNWVSYDFKERRIVPTHYAVRANWLAPGSDHLKSWLVETSGDGESWQEVGCYEDNQQLNGWWFIGTFAVAGREECRFIRLVNAGGNDCLYISTWEIFGNLFE
jgi:hypothetical protein